MKTYTKSQLITKEINRIRKLNTLSDSFLERERRDGIAIATNTFHDYIIAQSENEEAFTEVLTGVSPEPVALHLQACSNAGVEFCICDVLMGKEGTTEEMEAI